VLGARLTMRFVLRGCEVDLRDGVACIVFSSGLRGSGVSCNTFAFDTPDDASVVDTFREGVACTVVSS